MEAVIVIDMQKGLFKSTPRYESENVIKNINKITDKFRKIGNKAIFIQHDGSKQNCFFPGSEEWEILNDIKIEKTDQIIHKTANDSFYKTQLDKYLRDNDINAIYITGCATDYCVNATIHSALTKDYNIVVVKDGHTTADRPMIKAKTLIEFHNWIWADLTPTKGKIVIKETKEI